MRGSIEVTHPVWAGAAAQGTQRMYAIFEDGGKQYKVQNGDHLLVERRERADGEEAITFEKVLMVGEGADARIGQPYVAGATVQAKVLSELKTDKVVGVKFKRRKGYMRKFGHRQQMLRVAIESINA